MKQAAEQMESVLPQETQILGLVSTPEKWLSTVRNLCLTKNAHQWVGHFYF